MVPYEDFLKWFVCLFLIGGSIFEITRAIRGRKFGDGLLAIIGVMITILFVPWIFKI